MPYYPVNELSDVELRRVHALLCNAVARVRSIAYANGAILDLGAPVDLPLGEWLWASVNGENVVTDVTLSLNYWRHRRQDQQKGGDPGGKEEGQEEGRKAG